MLEALHPGRIDLGIGPRARHRPAHRGRAAPHRRGAVGGRLPPAARPSCAATSAGPGRPACTRRAGRRATSRRCGCSARAATAPRSPGCSGCRSRSPTTSAARTPCPRWRSTGRRSGRRGARRSRTRWSAPRCSPPTTTRGAPAGRCPAACRSCGCAGRTRARCRRSRRPRPTAYSPRERAFVEDRLAGQVIGWPGDGAARPAGAARRTGADELMVTTLVHDPARPAAVVLPAERGRGAVPA